MVSPGNAFRPPRRDDVEAWQVAEAVILAGYRYRQTSERQSFPRTLRELAPWLDERSAEQRWLPERRMAVGVDHTVRWGPRVVRDREPALVLVDGQWVQGYARLRGDGGRRLSSPVIALLRSRSFVSITPTTRARLRALPRHGAA
jgi:hypothetical protein